jgi:hypothetical protein
MISDSKTLSTLGDKNSNHEDRRKKISLFGKNSNIVTTVKKGLVQEESKIKE